MLKDLLVIGGGPGGYTAAIRASQLGFKVGLIEKRELGGTCLNRGCIPTKVFYKHAKLIEELTRLADFGINVPSYSLDLSKMQERKNQVVSQLTGGIAHLLKANKIEVIRGEACLTGTDTVLVRDDAGEVREYKASRILIATGSVPATPPILGLDCPGVFTSDQILDLKEVPPSLVIVGGGVIGLEYAGIFRALGSKVTVLEFLPQVLLGFDSEIRKRMAPTLKRKGIQVQTEVKVEAISKEDEGLKVKITGKKGAEEILCDAVLVATGRVITDSGLKLESMGVNFDRRGIRVNERYETNIPGIYAIGDVIGGQMLAHVAAEEGIAAVEYMAGLTGHLNYNAVPACVFTHPEIASVGLTEEKAQEQGIEYLTSKFMFGANGKALTMGEGEGFIKVLAAAGAKEILGVHIMGPNASDLIHEAALAVNKKLKVDDIAGTVHAHPTLAEAFLEAVLGIEKRAIHSAP